MKYTDEQFIEAMKAAVAEKGEDYKYPLPTRRPDADPYSVAPYLADDYHTTEGTCLYTRNDGAPACIIGVALSKIDTDLVPPSTDLSGADMVLGARGFSIAVQQAARVAQSHQDDGGSWGYALEAFLEEYEVMTNSKIEN